MSTVLLYYLHMCAGLFKGCVSKKLVKADSFLSEVRVFTTCKSKSTHQSPIFFVFRLPGQETKSTRLCNKNYLNALFQSFKSIRKLLLNRTMS